MRIRWTDSADKHGVSREDVVHAMLNAYLFRPGFDESREPDRPRPDLWIGPPVRLGGPLIEVMTETTPEGLRVFHAMATRQRFLDLLNEGE